MIIDSRGPDGNAFTIMGQVKVLLKQIGRSDEWEDIRERMFSGSYDELCDIAEEVTNGSIVVTNRG